MELKGMAKTNWEIIGGTGEYANYGQDDKYR